MQTTQLELTPLDAQIIDLSIRLFCQYPEDFRYFLISVGACLVSGEDRNIEVTERDLWYLRDIINPGIKVGSAMGVDTIRKVYNTLLTFYPGVANREIDLDGYNPKGKEMVAK